MNSTPRPSLLLVDDEPDLLLALQGLLRRRFQLFTATSGPEALEIIKAESIQIVMSDQRMPEMSGDELLAQVAVLSPATVRILLTGYADIQDVIRALNTGGLFRYLTKPWDLDELMDVLDQAVAVYQQNLAAMDSDERTSQFAARVVEFLKTLPDSEQVQDLLQQAEAFRRSKATTT